VKAFGFLLLIAKGDLIMRIPSPPPENKPF